MKATIIFCLLMTAVLGSYSVSLVGLRPWKPTRRAAHTEWTVGKEIKYQEQSCGLPSGAIAALIEHETGGTWDERSYNPEKKSTCYRTAKNSKERERCASRGLTQVVARWHLPEDMEVGILDNPVTAVRLGGAKLCGEYRRAKGDLRKAYERFNGTGPGARLYAAKVMNEFKYFSRMS